MLPALEPGVLITRACSFAAIGSKCPAHQQDPHPGYQNAMRLFMMALQPAPTAHYVKLVLIPACAGPTEALAQPFGLELDVTVEVHAIGHSAGSYSAMVCCYFGEACLFSNQWQYQSFCYCDAGIFADKALPAPGQICPCQEG